MFQNTNTRFHGACMGCNNPLSTCPDCRYMDWDWDLPDKNPVNIENKKRLDQLKARARRAKKEKERKQREALEDISQQMNSTGER